MIPGLSYMARHLSDNVDPGMIFGMIPVRSRAAPRSRLRSRHLAKAYAGQALAVSFKRSISQRPAGPGGQSVR